MKPSLRLFRMAVNLPKLADIEQLSPNVIRVLGGNPGKFTLQGSNTYILGRGPKRILLDTGEGRKEWIDNIDKALKEQNATIATCLLSHWHHDHVGGVKDLLGITPDAVLYKHRPSLNPDGLLEEDKVKDIHNSQRFSIGESDNVFEVEAVYCPGHTQDHMAFVVTQSSDAKELGAMFTADNVLGHGTAVFENLAQYLSSLAVMKDKVKGSSPKLAFPGHGAVIDDAQSKIEEYIAHRRMREEEAMNVLMYGATKKPSEGAGNIGLEKVPGKEWGSMEMVKVIYAHYPENLHAPAENGLLMVLEKLRGEGKVVKSNEGKWRISEKATL